MEQSRFERPDHYEDLIAFFESGQAARKIAGIAFRYGLDPETAKDVIQDVWIKAYRGRYNGTASLSTWVGTIARNTIFDYFRKMRGKNLVDIEDVDVTDNSPSADRLSNRMRVRALLFEAISNLGPGHQDVINKREFEDLKYKEIAEVLGIKLGTVMSRLHKARKRVKDVMISKGVDSVEL